MLFDIDTGEAIGVFTLFLTLLGGAWWVGRWMGLREGVERYDHSKEAMLQSALDMQKLSGTGNPGVYPPSVTEITKGTSRLTGQKRYKGDTAA